MKRFILFAALALGASAIVETAAQAGGILPGVGGHQRRIGRVQGFWLDPMTGRLKDYSTYFAHKYPWLPGAPEYQYHPHAAPYGAPAPAHRAHPAPAAAQPPGARLQIAAPARPIETVEPPRN